MKIGDIRFDCRFYTGYKPCGKSLECTRCKYYEPRGVRILIIKLAAMGDALRTTSLLRGLKKKYPASFITWVTDSPSIPLLSHNSYIDRLLEFSFDDVISLLAEEFDILINLEKEQRALGLAQLVYARDKRGFALNEFGTLGIYNPESEYALVLGLDDELKFRLNQKTYQEIIFEMACLPYKGEEYVLEVPGAAQDFGKQFFERSRLNSCTQVVGIHSGCGTVFRTKRWTVDGWAERIRLLVRDSSIGVVLMGGNAERELNRSILEKLGDKQDRVVDAGVDNSIEQVMGIMSRCDLIVGLDSLAMHIAIGLRKKLVALIGPTSHTEIDIYGRGEKILGECEDAPCYRNECNRSPRCMEKISPQRVADAVREHLAYR